MSVEAPIPSFPSASTSSASASTSAGSRTGPSQRGGGKLGLRKGPRTGPHRGLVDDDVGMVDASGESSSGKVRGRQSGRKSNGPMGERPLMKVDGKPYNPRTRNNPSRNVPALLRDPPSSSTTSKPSSSSHASASTSSAHPTKGAIETLTLFLQSRYSVEAKMLNLENMASDTILLEAGILPPGAKGAPSNVAAATWKLVGQLFPDMVSLSLANNSLTTILPLSPYLLTNSTPNLLNISLAANQLRNVRDLDPLSPSIGKPRLDKKQKGWPKLQELVLTGNPMVVVGGNGELEYKSEIARRFPSLRQLDQVPIDPSIAFVSTRSSKNHADGPGLSPAVKKSLAKSNTNGGETPGAPVVFPVSVSGGFFESEGTRDFVAGFLMKFFPAFDSDRPSLAPVYSPVCSFSYSADTSVPSRTRAQKIGGPGDKTMPNQHKLDWTNYLTGSRNLSRVNHIQKRIATLHVSPPSVVTTLASFPQTLHPLNEASKFVFDAWTMPGLLAPTAAGAEGETVIMAIVHGEFVERPSEGVRSFDRTFILAPAPPGSPAAQAGWPCMILSDLFVIRGYSVPSAWAPKPDPTTAAVEATPPRPQATPIQERAEGLTDEQQALVLQLQSVTRLTYSFAHLCLVQNNWVPETAMSNFQSLQASGAIPAEAFMP